MSRFAAVAAAFMATLVVVFTAAPARAIDPAYTQFETPETEILPDNCRTDAVNQRREELMAAVSRLGRKIERMEKAVEEGRTAMDRAGNDARRSVLLRDYLDLVGWLRYWRNLRSQLRGQLAYYNALPSCNGGGRGRSDAIWPLTNPAVPSGQAVPYTPRCISPEGLQRLRGVLEDNTRFGEELRSLRASVIAKLAATGAGRNGLDDDISRMAILEEIIHHNNRFIRELEAQHPCVGEQGQRQVQPHGQQGALATPPVRLGDCEAGVLAAINAARADPAGYANSLKGARGQSAAEARAFLEGLSPAPALTVDSRLSAAALAHAEDLAARDAVSHTGANGAGLLDRFRSQGLFVTLAAEEIAISTPSPAGAVRQLIIDEGNPGGPHRRDLFNGRFTQVGIACIETRRHGRLVVIDLSNAPMRRDE